MLPWCKFLVILSKDAFITWQCVTMLILRNLPFNTLKTSRMNLSVLMGLKLKLLPDLIPSSNLVCLVFSSWFFFVLPILSAFLLVFLLMSLIFLLFMFKRHIHTENQETVSGHLYPAEYCKVEWWTLWSPPNNDLQCSGSSWCWWKVGP